MGEVHSSGPNAPLAGKTAMDVNLHQSPPIPSKPSRSSVRSRLPLIAALRRPHLARLWLSQVLSAIGDQLYTIAIIWIAIRMVGREGGLVVAAESAAALVCGLLGGVYVDRWDRQVTMMAADALRALAVLALPILSVLGGLRFWELLVVAVVLGGLSTVFDPALQASLPSLADDSQTLNAANALMDITRRLARIFGPGLAGVLVAILPLTHFFTLDAVSFALSALAVLSLGRRFAWKPRPISVATSGRAGVWQEICETMGLVYRHRLLWYTLLTLGIITLAWGVGFTLGAALLAARVLHGGVGAYGLIVGAYGVGNVASNIAVGSLHIRRQPLLIFGGKLILGAGFLLLALSPSLPFALIAAAIAAVGGPMSDLPLQRLVQLEIPPEQLGKVFSLRNLTGEGGFMLGLLLAPMLFAALPIRATIASAAVVMACAGLVGLLRFGWGSGAG